MSILGSLLGPLLEKREFSLTRWVNWLDSLESQTSASGLDISDSTALNWSVVWGCVMVLAQDVAKRPLKTYRRLGQNGEQGREEAPQHPLWRIFRVAANPYTSAYIFRESMQKHLNIRGNAYALIDRDGAGNVRALWLRSPKRMTPAIKDGRLAYKWRTEGGIDEEYPPDRVFHLRHMSDDGITGLSPVEVFRDGIGLGLGYQQYAGNTFRNAVRPSLLAKTTQGPEKAKEIAAAIKEQYAGIQKAGGVLIGYGGLEFQPWGFSNKDAEFIESRHFSVEEACRIWRVPPHKVMEYLRATFSNVTQIDLSYVNDTLRPWDECWEQEIHLKLLREEEQPVFYVEHDNFDLLKGTPVERSQVEVAYVNSGISTINEVRESHNWNPVAGGDRNRTQMQNVPIGEAPAQPEPIASEPARR